VSVSRRAPLVGLQNGPGEAVATGKVGAASSGVVMEVDAFRQLDAVLICHSTRLRPVT